MLQSDIKTETVLNILQAPVVEKADSGIHWINLFPVDNAVDFSNNHNYNKIVQSDWLSTALISALIGQFNRTVCVMPK